MFLFGVQKPEPLDVFDFLEPFRRLSVMKINSPPPSKGPDGKELKAFLKAMNRQMKTDESSFGDSDRLPVPTTVSAEDYVGDLFRDPGEGSKFMQGSVRGDAELTLLSSDGHNSIPDVLAAFLQPTSHIHRG